MTPPPVDNLDARLQEHLKSSHTIQFELGGGGMSRTFVAEERALNRRVVVKVLNPGLAATVSVERFQREIMVVAKLNHPNIVPVLTAGEIDSLPYFIMPYIEGESLRSRIARGPLSLRETVVILKDVARALAYAHSAGIVHRDIKPDNILLSGAAAMVTDFGVAKAVTAARNRGTLREGQTITGVGISLGTPQYMAPEQAAADPNADGRVDIYALGIVAYEMLVGSPPFFGRTPQALLAAQLTELPAPLASRRYDIPVGLSDVIMQCLEKDPADRPRNAADLARTFESPEVLSGPIAATPEARSRKRNRQLAGTAGASLFVLTLAAIVIWSLWPARATATNPASDVVSVRMAQASSIGAESAAPAAAMSSAIQAALIRAGMRVLPAGGASSDSVFVVETTLQRSGTRARAHVRLTSPGPNADTWAEQLDFAIDSSFAAQDSLADRVVRAVIAANARRVSR
jgi:serine/threonine protein kinase